MASWEEKKARRQKLEELLRSKLSFRGKCNFFVPIEFIDIHTKETKNKSNPDITYSLHLPLEMFQGLYDIDNKVDF